MLPVTRTANFNDTPHFMVVLMAPSNKNTLIAEAIKIWQF